MFQTLRNYKLIMRQSVLINAIRKASSIRMQAWQIHSYGDLSEIQLSQARIPIINDPDDVLVEVHAASLNPIDKMIIGGYGKTFLRMLRGEELEFPLTLGRDFAGTIIDKGHRVGSKFEVGDEVYGSIAPYKQGSLAKAVICSKNTLCHRPSNISPLEATSMSYAAMTAWSALFLYGELNVKSASQSRILILGAAGGVGTAAVQILKALGAVVVGTCSRDAIPMVKTLGADYVFDYNDKEYVSHVADIGRYDIILDCAKFGYQNIPESWTYKNFVTLNSPLLLNGDKYGLIGGLTVSAKDIISANCPVFLRGRSIRWAFYTSSSDGLQFITKLIKEGKMKPVIHKIFKFHEVPEAFTELSKGHLRGKIVIDFDEGINANKNVCD